MSFILTLQTGIHRSLDQLGHRADMRDNSAEILFQPFLQEAIVNSSGMDRDVHSLMLSIQHFLLLTRALPTFQGALKDGFGETVVACDMPEPCKFPSLHSCQKGFLWTHKEVDLALHPVVGLVIQVGDAEKFPHALGFESLDPFFRVRKHGALHPQKPLRLIRDREDGGRGQEFLYLTPTRYTVTTRMTLH